MDNVPVLTSQTTAGTINHQPPSSIVTVARVVYILGIATGASIIGAFLFGWPSIAAVVLNYVMRSEARGTFVDSHFSWQIHTFWYAMGWAVLVAIVGFFLSFVFVGFFIWTIGFVVMGIWVGYRIIRGWMRLLSRQPMPLA